MNDKIAEMINEGKEDAVIVYYIHDHSTLSLSEATAKLKEAKMWMAWHGTVTNRTKKDLLNLKKHNMKKPQYDLAPTLRMLKGEREAAKETKDKSAMAILDALIKKLRSSPCLRSQKKS